MSDLKEIGFGMFLEIDWNNVGMMHNGNDIVTQLSGHTSQR